MSHYYAGLNQKLLDAIPKNALKILELGCANGRLGQQYKKLNPESLWIGLDIEGPAIVEASKVLDKVYNFDIENSKFDDFIDVFDVIVIGDLLENLKNPEETLEKIYNISSPNAVIVCCLPNVTHLSVVHRLISGDFSYDDAGLLDRTHKRLFSPSSAIKIFLDNGWLPDIFDQYNTEIKNDNFTNSVIEAASSIGIPSQTIINQLSTYQMIFRCEKWDMTVLKKQGPMAPFSIIVPVNKTWQYDLNILKSPGLKEIDAEIIPVVNATSAAEAFNYGASKAKNAWKLFVHQDVYFPSGTGLSIACELGKLSASGSIFNAVGFAGLEKGSDGESLKSGLFVDRTKLYNCQSSEAAFSIDEFAVALHSDAKVSIDSKLGWHLWVTDLCFQASIKNKKSSSIILNTPLFHNSVTDYLLPSTFFDSLKIFFNKYPDSQFIETLCGLFHVKDFK